ncbi:MAG TPA: hypothetical protein VJS92_15805 [Candidatus Polarisedimenticolaceae bacterium]|nr:hypothetical protein [Candidatus Polarisedimenticolaceae bacterium]
MPRRVLKRGEAYKADLLLVDLDHGPTVVKDFHHKRTWVRLAGRLQVARECRAYRWLGTLSGVPRFYGRIDAHALAFEHLAGRPLGTAPDRAQGGSEKLRRLREVIDRLHARGLVHWDLRARENVLVDATGTIYVLDFASAMWLRPGGLAHRLLFGWMRRIDESAYLKWKQLLGAGPYTPEEQAFLRRFHAWRPLWPFRRGRRQ